MRILNPAADARGRRRLDMGLVAGGVFVVAVCAVVVRDGTVGSSEKAFFDAINGLPDFLEAPLWVFQLLGLLLTPLVFAVVAFALGRRFLAAGLVAAIPLKLVLERAVIKQLVERERPGTTVPDAIIRDASIAGLSFPSGHAVLAFAIAVLAAPYLARQWQVVLFALASLNGIARVYLGAHTPVDFVAGAALGIAIAASLNLLFKVPLAAE